MKQVYIQLLIILIGVILMICGEQCTLNGTVMDCTGKKLNDCPTVKPIIKTLILDNNLLVNFTTDDCLGWSHLNVLSVQNNLLNTLSDFSSFQDLTSLNLAYNKIGNLQIKSSSLETLDASHNKITDVKLLGLISNLDNYKTIILGDNQIGNVPNLIKMLHNANNIETLDLSYNNLDSLTQEFMTLKANNLKFLNLAGNRLTQLNFNVFKSEMGAGYSFNVSKNLITNWTIGEVRHIVGLDFSNNKLSTIDGDTFKYFQGLGRVDLSHNLLNCLCNETASFIFWMQQNKDKVTHASETMCDKPERKHVLDVICTTSSSTARPTTTSRVTSDSTSKFSTVTSAKSAMTSTTASQFTVSTIHNSTPTAAVTNNSWKIAMGFIIPIIIIILIVAGYIYLCRHRPGYQEIGATNSRSLLYNCVCIPFQAIRSRRRGQELLVNHENDLPNSSDYPHLHIDEIQCIIICSSQDTKWVNRDIVSHLQIGITVIDSKTTPFPYADYILVVVHGHHCLKDSTFIYNVETVLKAKDPSEIRLLINKRPSEEIPCKSNTVTEFIKSKLVNKQFFEFNSDNTTTCIMTLRSWLKLTNVPHNV